MSLAELSNTIKTHITSRLKEVITGDPLLNPTERQLNNFSDYTSSKVIRNNTNSAASGHESVMSRGGMLELQNQLVDAINAGKISSICTDVVNNIDFDQFILYAAQTYNYEDRLSSNTRESDTHVYHGDSRAAHGITALTYGSSKSSSTEDVLILKNIPHGTIVSLFVDYCSTIITGQDAGKIIEELKASLQGGHLTGVFTARLIRAFGLQKDTSSTSGVVRFSKASTEPLTLLEKQLASIVNLVTDADYLSSNIVLDVSLFSNTDKRLYRNAAEIRLTTEVQVKFGNEEAGDLLKAAGASLSKLITTVKNDSSSIEQSKAAAKQFNDLLLNLNKVQQYIKDKAQLVKNTHSLSKESLDRIDKALQNADVIDKLINTPGSPSFVKHVQDIVLATLEGKAAKTYKTVANSKDKIVPNKTTKVSSKQPRKSKTISVGLANKPVKKQNLPSLTNLQSLLSARIVEQVKKNMGTGNAKNILNLRTGRFAESTKVERLSQSREGMITAFYSYMRNPYGTFSEGGAQQYPKTRDPKLLISKSIREIGAEAAYLRMRAVLV